MAIFNAVVSSSKKYTDNMKSKASLGSSVSSPSSAAPASSLPVTSGPLAQVSDDLRLEVLAQLQKHLQADVPAHIGQAELRKDIAKLEGVGESLADDIATLKEVGDSDSLAHSGYCAT